MPDLPATIKDAAYVTVGLGVLAFQKAQVRRVELQKQVRVLTSDVDARLAPVRHRLDVQLDALTGLLPQQARGLLDQARTTAKQTLGGRAA
jgi:hypothetical protein